MPLPPDPRTSRPPAFEPDSSVPARPGLGPVTLGAVLHARRAQLGLTLQRLADLAGCTKSYLSAIENDRRDRPPSEELLTRVEAALGLKAGELVELARWEATPASIRRHLRELGRKHAAARRLVAALHGGARGEGGARSLDALYKSGRLRTLIEQIEAMEGAGGAGGDPGRAEPEQASATGKSGAPRGGGGSRDQEALALLPLEIPLINLVAAGQATEFTDLGYPARIADEYVRAPDVGDPDAFAARVTGDSMLPEYREGDIVVFSPAKPVKSGMDCFARLLPDHESTFKRAYFEEDADGQAVIRLQPLNSAHRPRLVRPDDVAGLYAAVSVTRVL